MNLSGFNFQPSVLVRPFCWVKELFMPHIFWNLCAVSEASLTFMNYDEQKYSEQDRITTVWNLFRCLQVFAIANCTICSHDGAAKVDFSSRKKGGLFFLKVCDQEMLGFCQNWLTKKWKLLEAFKLKILRSVSIASLFLIKNSGVLEEAWKYRVFWWQWSYP